MYNLKYQGMIDILNKTQAMLAVKGQHIWMKVCVGVKQEKNQARIISAYRVCRYVPTHRHFKR